MSKKNSTLIVCVLDRSGSMSTILDDAVGGFNTFLEEQQKVKGKCNMTVAMFDDKYELKYNNESIKKVEPFTNTSYCPRGCTALLDAIGKTINNVNKEIDELPEKKKPEKVILVILTDGAENASKEFNSTKISEMIKEQQETHKWDFVYLAADEAGFKAGQQLGFANSTRYDKNDARAMYSCVSEAVATSRCSGKVVEIDKDIT